MRTRPWQTGSEVNRDRLHRCRRIERKGENGRGAHGEGADVVGQLEDEGDRRRMVEVEEEDGSVLGVLQLT